MGGWGSGRDEYATTPTAEECRQMDIDDLKELTKHPGEGTPAWWGSRDDPEASIGICAEGDADLEDTTRADVFQLTYTVTDTRAGGSREYDYTIPLEYTECNFGGVRPWFRCPGCGDRRRKLYLPPRQKRFRCRECDDLGYRSSRTSGDEFKQAELRYRRAFAKADAKNRRPHPYGEPYAPERPKGMHQETFDRLKWQVTLAELEWTEEMRKKTNRLIESLDYTPDRTIPNPLAEE